MKKMMLVLSFFVAGQMIASENERLYDAIRHGDLAGVDRALAAGADVNAKNMFGSTALILAARYGNDQIVQILIAAGVDVNAKTWFGDTALSWAAKNGRDQMVKDLLEAGANLKAVNNDGNTALMEAAQNGRDQIVQILVVAGADVNAVNNDGNTALISAAKKGKNEIVRKLIKAKADVNIANNYGKTALARADNGQIVKDLLVAGADIPNGLSKKEIDWLDRIITEINEERVLEFQSFLSLQDRKNMPVQDLLLLMYPLLPLASEVHAQRRAQAQNN